MNNKPVAWMSKIDNHIVTFDKRLVDEAKHAGADNWMPMYLHPVKELTDEEIFKMALEQYGHSVGLYGNHIGFARAILRKAQEK
jgi:hypothetical protein